MFSVTDAITSKYGPDDNDNGQVEIPIAIYVPRQGPRKRLPSLLVLDNCGIDTAGSDEELRAKCGSVRELDLAQNKLNDWDQVIKILKHMPNVVFVNLSFNLLSGPLQLCVPPIHFPSLTTLILNGTRVTWTTLDLLLQSCPRLEELGLNLNEFECVGLGPNAQYESVHLLYFNANPICQWREVQRLGDAFPHLESLVLADCPIVSFKEDECEAPPSPPPSPSTACPPQRCHFPHLTSLNLNHTLVSSWLDIDFIDKLFPVLKELRIQGCPVFEDYTEHERRQFLIARLPSRIEKLNGGADISFIEREDAERAFIRYFACKLESEQPPRYRELTVKHGYLQPLVDIDLRPETRVDVTVTFHGRSEKQTVSVYQSVAELKQRLEKWAGIPANRMKLYYVDQEMCKFVGPEEMRFPSKQLYSYNIRHGDEIIVDLRSQ